MRSAPGMRQLVTVLALASLPVLYGCVAAAVGGAAAGGYLVGEDRRSASVLTDDQGIELRAGNRIGEKHGGAHVNATSYNRLVLLTGEVPTEEAKADIERITREVPNVRGTFNELQVKPVSAMSARANDSYITSKVKARFVDGGRFNVVHVKVVTEDGTVFLMGIVKRQEADNATELARTTTGVKRVVRVFEYQD
jgi:osmotically-inducible protein OsmY